METNGYLVTEVYYCNLIKQQKKEHENSKGELYFKSGAHLEQVTSEIRRLVIG